MISHERAGDGTGRKLLSSARTNALPISDPAASHTLRAGAAQRRCVQRAPCRLDRNLDFPMRVAHFV
jgi:hypothetical protein